MRKILGTAAASLLILSAAACSSGPDGDGRECLDVSADVMEAIAEGSNEHPITPIAAAAVRSETRSDVTIIAMSFREDAAPDEQQEGVWGVGGQLEDFPGIGPWLSIDSIADLYSDFPNEMSGVKFDITEDGATEALDCLAAL